MPVMCKALGVGRREGVTMMCKVSGVGRRREGVAVMLVLCHDFKFSILFLLCH